MNSTSPEKTRVSTTRRSAPTNPLAPEIEIEPSKKIFFVDDLHHRWERIVLGERP